jgi:hypothetical protein
MKHRTTLQKLVALAVSVCLLLSLGGCGSGAETESSESQSSKDTETTYREFNASDFGRKEVLLGTLKDSESRQAALKVYSTDGDEGGRLTGLLFTSLFVDIEGNSGFDVTYVSTIGVDGILGTKQYYYKVEVEDLEVFKENVGWWTAGDHKVDTSNWKEDDEIYLQCDLFQPDQQVRFYFRFKNYTADETQKDTAETVATPAVNETANDAETSNPVPSYEDTSSEDFEGDNWDEDWEQEIDDLIPYVPTLSSDILGTTFSPQSLYTKLIDNGDDGDIFDIPLNGADGLTYYMTDTGSDDEAYGVRDGIIVAYLLYNGYDFTVGDLFGDVFDDTPPKTIGTDMVYHIWRVNDGYLVLCALDTNQGYLNDKVGAEAYFTDINMCPLLTED